MDRTTNDNGYVRDLTFEELKHKFIDEEVVVECHENDIGVNAWVVNEIEDIERMKELGVDIISSDYPDRVYGMQIDMGKSYKILGDVKVRKVLIHLYAY